MEPKSPALQAESLLSEQPGTPTFPLNYGVLENFLAANGAGERVKNAGSCPKRTVTFSFCCIPNTHVLPACCRACNILAEAAAYNLSAPSRSAWRARKILCERFFSPKASLREPAIFWGKARLLKANTQWVYFSPMWCNNNNNIFSKKCCLRKGCELGLGWLGFRSWYAAKQPDVVLWGKINLKRKKKRKKETSPGLGKGNKAYEGVWYHAKSKRIFH